MNFKKVKAINRKNLNGVVVIDGDLNSALRVWKKIVKDANIVQECYDRKFYDKPSVVKKKQKEIAKYNQSRVN